MLASLLNWGLSLIFGGLLARALARRDGPAHGLPCRRRGGLSRARRDLGAGPQLVGGAAPGQPREPAEERCSPITGVIPFTETIFLWQSMLIAAVLLVVSVVIAYASAPRGGDGRDRARPGRRREPRIDATSRRREQPGEWLEHSPLLTILLVADRRRLDRAGVHPPRRGSSRSRTSTPTTSCSSCWACCCTGGRKRFLMRGRQGGAGDRRHADPVSALRGDQPRC